MKKHLGLFVGLFVIATGAKADRISERCMPFFTAGDLASYQACQVENRDVNIALAREYGVNVNAPDFDPNFPCKNLTPGSVARTNCMNAAGNYNVQRAIQVAQDAQTPVLVLPTPVPPVPPPQHPTSYEVCQNLVDTNGQTYQSCQTVTEQFASFTAGLSPR